MASRAYKTFADLAALGEDARVEVIHGELVPKAAPSGEHAEAENHVLAMLMHRFDRAERGRWPGGWWIRSEVHVEYETKEVFCHDLVGWRRASLPGKPLGWPVRAHPDWVCEVLSPSHEKRDRKDKMAVLERHGVAHYWILDREEQLLEIYRHMPTGYVHVMTAAVGETIRAEPFDAVELRTDVIFGLADDDE